MGAKVTLDDLLHGDQGRYGYLFPYRDRVPNVRKHIFTDLKQSKDPLDQVVVSRMLDINYIGWTAKVVLGLDLFPIQIATLQMMWNTPFPMLIACRGGSKCVRGDTLCRTSDGLIRMDEIVDPQSPEMERISVDCEMHGENGLNKPSYGWNNGHSKTKVIKLRSGIEIEVTDNHPIRCVNEEGKIIWRNAEEISPGDYIPICRDQYDFGNDPTTSEDLGWWLGVMTGDGMFTQRSCLRLSSTNQSVVDEFIRITQKEFGYEPRPLLRPGHYNIYNVKIWDNIDNLYNIGGKDSYTKEVPRLIRQSPRKVVSAFIKGLFDADGCVSENRSRISYTSCSELLARQVQQILLGFGIVCTCRERYTKSQNGTEVKSYQLVIDGEYNVALYAKYIGFVHSRKYSRLQNRIIKFTNPNNDLIPNIQSVMVRLREKFVRDTGGPNKRGYGHKNTFVSSPCRILQYVPSYNKLEKFLDVTQCICDDEDWRFLKKIYDKHYYYDYVESVGSSCCQTFDVYIPDDHSFISNGLISHNSFMLAVYAVLRALLDPGTKIVIVGAGLRQARLVFNYIDTIWGNAPVLRNIVGGGKKAGPRQNVDLCYFRVGDSIVYALPMGDGTKIRGFRANVVIADEFACLDKDTLVETQNGLERISDITDINTKVLNRYGELESIGSLIKTPKTDVYEVVTKYGYRFKCSNKHKVLTQNGWKLGKDLTIDDFIITENKYTFPTESYDDFITKDMAWLIGLLISEGDVTNEHCVSIRTTDTSLVERIKDRFDHLNPKVYIREPYTDGRGWDCKKSYEIKIHNTEFRKKLFDLGIGYSNVYEKRIPNSILRSPVDISTAFLSGLFYGDGSCFLWKDRSTTKLGVAYYTVSDILAQDVQTLLLKFDIIIGRRTRKSQLSHRKQWILRANGIHAHRLSELLEIDDWKELADVAHTHSNKDTYGVTFDKSRNQWKAAVLYCGKVRYLGRYDTKDEAVSAVKEFLDNNNTCLKVESVRKLDYQDHLYDFHLPNTHSFYGNGFVQHNSIPEDVFDVVVRGFAATAKTPVEEAKRAAFEKQLAKLDLPADIKKKITTDNGRMHGNQIVYSGTAYYAFNHFAKKYEMWRKIIRSKGDPDQVAQIFGGENLVPEGFDYRDYAIIRIPHTHLPEGLLDQRQLAHAKATLPRNIYLMEYGAVFVKDSDGFYPRSLIEGCTVGPNKPIETPDGPVTFTPLMRAQSKRKYVMGVDPAAERDNLAITMIEVWPNHYRIVYCWAVNKKEFLKRKKRGLITDDDYYAYCCAKIRDVVRLFNPVRIEMDSQGGGYAIAEMLRNKKLMNIAEDDFPIYEVIDFNEPKDTDGETDGRHILYLVKQSTEYNQDANVVLHKSLETRTLLFPAFDSVKMYAAIEAEKAAGVIFDTYEENVFNLEELKNELCTIQMSETATGKERFDTPQVVQPGAVEGRTRKGRLRKDRYTALLLSHKYIYDTDVAMGDDIDYEDVPGNIAKREKAPKNEAMYRGPGVGRMRNAQDTRHGGVFKAIKKGRRI